MLLDILLMYVETLWWTRDFTRNSPDDFWDFVEGVSNGDVDEYEAVCRMIL